MEIWSGLCQAIINHWTVWFVTIALIVAAVIDGFELRVPNWLTFPLIISGWIYSVAVGGQAGLTASLVGTAVGLALLLPAYAIGGMGAGDVKLLAGVGAWMHYTDTVNAFCVSAVIGAVLAVAMVVVRGDIKKHVTQFWTILNEIMTIRNMEQLSEIAAQRKKSMLLLPYGIPIAMGSIAYFAWSGLLV